MKWNKGLLYWQIAKVVTIKKMTIVLVAASHYLLQAF